MKRSWLIACLMGTMATVQAQTISERGGTPTERADKLTAKMAENLDLTDEQRTTVAEINLKYAEEVADFREKNRAQREALKEIRQNQEAALQEVLTEAQVQTYEARRDERQDHRRKKRGEGRSRP